MTVVTLMIRWRRCLWGWETCDHYGDKREAVGRSHTSLHTSQPPRVSYPSHQKFSTSEIFLSVSSRGIQKLDLILIFQNFFRENLLHHITTFSGRRDQGVEAHCCDYSNLDRLWWYQASDHRNESGPEIRVKVLVEEEGRSKVDYPARDSHAPALEPAHASDKDKHTHIDTDTHRQGRRHTDPSKYRHRNKGSHAPALEPGSAQLWCATWGTRKTTVKTRI